VDQSDWSAVLKQQEAALLAGYPSLGDRLSVRFQHSDILDPTASSLLPFPTASVITLLFTISELFLQSRSATLSLLSTITNQTRPGTLLIIVESASLGQIPIGTSGNTYPLGMLLDSALTQTKGRAEEDRAKWEILQEEENKWYRMPTGSEECYPLKLENSRVVSRVLRRL
jgi:25S rRNA (uracil2843-N3)-methyltransferase